MSRNSEIERSFASDRETWHAIATAPGWERRVVDALAESGFEPYLPELTQITIVKGRKVASRRLVIPSYVFVRLAIWRDNSWGKINRRDMEGVVGIVKNGALPVAIPDRQMDRLAKLEHTDADVDAILAWLAKSGQIVLISRRKQKRAVRIRQYLARMAAA